MINRLGSWWKWWMRFHSLYLSLKIIIQFADECKNTSKDVAVVVYRRRTLNVTLPFIHSLAFTTNVGLSLGTFVTVILSSSIGVVNWSKGSISVLSFPLRSLISWSYLEKSSINIIWRNVSLYTIVNQCNLVPWAV